MLEVPDVRELINSTCVLTHVIATDVGVPDVPALAEFRRMFETDPWSHMNFGHFVVVTPDGAELLSGTGTIFRTIEEQMAVFNPKKAIRLINLARVRRERFRDYRRRMTPRGVTR